MDNLWRKGLTNLAFPPLTSQEVGRVSLHFGEVTFDPAIGTEIFLAMQDEPKWAEEYGRHKEIDLNAKCMAVQTSRGPVALIIWELVANGRQLLLREHYLEPAHAGTLGFMQRLAGQSRLKLVLRDNLTGETKGFWEFNNIFEIAEFGESCRELFQKTSLAPFDDRMRAAQQEYTVEQLWNAEA